MARTEAAPRTVRLLTALLLVATFAAGTVTGAAICRWAGPKCRPFPPPPPFWGIGPLEEVGMSADQSRKVLEIAERHRPELEAILKETFPKVRAINERMEQEAREVLTAEQRAKLDQIKALRPPPRLGPHSGHPPGQWGPMGPPPAFGPPPGPPPSTVP